MRHFYNIPIVVVPPGSKDRDTLNHMRQRARYWSQHRRFTIADWYVRQFKQYYRQLVLKELT